MDNFKIIYRILKAFEKAMDHDEFNQDDICPEALDITMNRWKKIMKMLSSEGYIDGVRVIETNMNCLIIKMVNPSITLRGLEYLNENSFMKKAADFAKGVSELIP